ncbi:hypothetical protein RUND412_000845 [Rhizina undulata]
MPRAEAGSIKSLSNRMKAKGLQRLRWYCQICEKQCRDENGFKCHTQSESHVRQMLLVGEDPKKFIAEYSNQFQKDFITLLRSSHGEKKINANHFYQEYIANKAHIHMNATRWTSLSEFVKYLGREGICRVVDDEKGFFISWIDNSPEALQRQEAIRKKERQDRGDEEREQRLIQEQVEKARREAELNGKRGSEESSEARELKRNESMDKIKLAFGAKKAASLESQEREKDQNKESTPAQPEQKQPQKVSIKVEAKKPKNVFAAASKKKDVKKESSVKPEQSKRPMSEAERIMREEMERKRMRGNCSDSSFKRQKVV